MFITVAVSEEKECLFNPDCMINVLLAAIKKRSNIPRSGRTPVAGEFCDSATWYPKSSGSL